MPNGTMDQSIDAFMPILAYHLTSFIGEGVARAEAAKAGATCQ